MRYVKSECIEEEMDRHLMRTVTVGVTVILTLGRRIVKDWNIQRLDLEGSKT
jgi:hypothetical protein